MSKKKKTSKESQHAPSESSSRLRPIQEVLQQLRWDGRFHEREYTLGYEERFSGIQETSVTDFLDGQEIPYHRVRYIRHGQTRVWDREARIDQLVPSSQTSQTPQEITNHHPSPFAFPPFPHEQELSTPSTLAKSSEASTPSTSSSVPTASPSATLASELLTTTPPVYRSSVVIIPPESTWEPIQAIRREHDKSFVRWMPHINLVYGFLPDEHFEEAAKVIAETVAKLSPFLLTMAQFRQFDHNKSQTVWLHPDPTPHGAIHQLQAQLQALFPQCNEQNQRSATGFTPHLTVAQFARDAKPGARQYLQQWQEEWTPFTFSVGHVYLISRRDDQPFEIRHAIPLGQSAQTSASPTQSATSTQITQNTQSPESSHPTSYIQESSVPDAAISGATAFPEISLPAENLHAWERFGEAWQLALEGVSLYLIGSHLLEVALPGGDIDLMALFPNPLNPSELYSEFAELLEQTGELTYIRNVQDALFPAWKFELAGQSFEIQCIQVPPSFLTLPTSEWRQHLPKLDYEIQRILSARLESEAILQKLGSEERKETFRTLLRTIKQWAQAREIDTGAWGYFSGISWAICAAWSLLYQPRTKRPTEARIHIQTDPQLRHLIQFFDAITAWNWADPIALTRPPSLDFLHPKKDRMPVLATLPPHANTTRTITASTSVVLQDEFQRAAKLLHELPPGSEEFGAFMEKLARPTPSDTQETASTPRSQVHITLQCKTRITLETSLGWLKQQFLPFLLQLEQATPWMLRPYHLRHLEPTQADSPFVAKLSIGLFSHEAAPLQPPQASDFQPAFDWLTQEWQRTLFSRNSQGLAELFLSFAL